MCLYWHTTNILKEKKISDYDLRFDNLWTSRYLQKAQCGWDSKEG